MLSETPSPISQRRVQGTQPPPGVQGESPCTCKTSEGGAGGIAAQAKPESLGCRRALAATRPSVQETPHPYCKIRTFVLEYPHEVGPRPASLPWSLPHTLCTGGIHRESPCGGASGETSPSPTTVRGRVRPMANAVSRQALCSRAAPPRSMTTQRQLLYVPSRLADGSVTACDALVTASVPENPRNPAATRHTYIKGIGNNKQSKAGPSPRGKVRKRPIPAPATTFLI